MRIALGSDHRGFELKQEIAKKLTELGYNFHDFGCFSPDAVDYPDIAQAVGKAVASGEFERGVLICYSGIGMSIAANKVKGVRAALCDYPQTARLARQHNDANILCLAAIHEPEKVLEILEVFLASEFEGGRHLRRVEKIKAIESCLG